MKKVGSFQKLLSYLYPVKIAQAYGNSCPILYLYLWQNRYQLVASTAVYSDGKKYKPLRIAFRFLKQLLRPNSTVLVLGAGLGSAVDILEDLKIPATYTLVDIDPQSTAWGKELHAAIPGIEWLCEDAQTFVVQKAAQNAYKLIVIDIFQDRLVPRFVTQNNFLNACKAMLDSDGGLIVFNYIVNNEKDWEATQATIKQLFHVQKVFSMGINRVMILQNNGE